MCTAMLKVSREVYVHLLDTFKAFDRVEYV